MEDNQPGGVTIPKWFLGLTSVVVCVFGVPLITLAFWLNSKVVIHESRISNLELENAELIDTIKEHTKAVSELKFKLDMFMTVRPADVLLEVQALRDELKELKAKKNDQ